ncbi:hypothetical protein AHAS_Ahas01G0149600 [Arachis hypogaea]
MMVGTGSMSRSASSLVDMMLEKDDDGRFTSGGWKKYLKEHLFDNLMKHPKFFTDAKLAISEMYQGTDSQFLDSKKDTFWDDSSIASTTVLIDNYLYVANVGDSRTIISKAGKAITLSEDHKPNRSDERKKN